MKPVTQNFFRHPFKSFVLALMSGLGLAATAHASGTWVQLNNAPSVGVNNCILLSDGTVLGMNGSGACMKLTPDIHGSYINGTWTTLASMHNSRLFFGSQLLTNGDLWVAGGEDGNGGSSSEMYSTLNNTWTILPPPTNGYPAFSDSISEILPNGNPLDCPVYKSTECIAYNINSNAWITEASCFASQDEADWVKLPSDNIVTIDAFSQNSEHYVPSLNEWIVDGTVPVPLYDTSLGEIGTGHLLPNGKVFYIGSLTNTAIYTPGASITSAGTWVAGVGIPNGLGAADAPAATLVNGNILCCLGPSATYNGPCSFYEYNYLSNTFTQVTAPGGGLTLGNTAPFGTSMLDLPDGTVLFIDGQNGTTLYVYEPNGAPLTNGQPVINTISENTDGTYQLTGTGLNGISEGAAYGDDEQMSGNYPLVRMTNTTTLNVYYARTFGWNSTSVQTGSRVITTKFSLPQALPAGTYSLVVSAVGIASAPHTFTYSPPSVPTGLAAAGGSNTFVNLQWNTVSGATAYNVKRSLTSGGYYATVATVTTNRYTDTKLTNGLAYYYKVAAVATGGPSTDSSSVSATPAGMPILPGTTNVNLASYYNRASIYTDGHTFSGGLDGGGYAYSANLLGTALAWNNLVFPLGPANASDVVYCNGQVINLPSGSFNSLEFLATGVEGNQSGLTFTVTFTDNSTATFTQNFSDWANPQSYQNEFNVITMPYRNGSGSSQTLNVSVDAYVFTLDQTKTVKSITLPSDSDVVILSIVLANNTALAPLSSYYNLAGIYTDGTTYTNPATGGLDGGGSSYSGTLTGNSMFWNSNLFAFGPLNQTNVVAAKGQVIPLTPGKYSRLKFLGTGIQGNQTSQSFIVTYSDNTTTTFSQNLSDWFTPGTYAGQSIALPMGHRNESDGSSDGRSFYLYGYNQTLNSAKIVKSITLPNDANVIVAALSLVPNWPPTFAVSPLTLPNINAGTAFSSTLATNASDLNGDTLTYAKVSGPAWLSASANGALYGTPANTDANTNTFVFSVSDPGGLSNTVTIYLYVNGAPSFTVNPFTAPSVTAGQPYSGTIATNATDPNPGDTLTYALVSGPAWLSVAANGALSGTPSASDVGTNTFDVSVTDPGNLSGTATMYVVVQSTPTAMPSITFQPSNGFVLNWTGGTGPYQVQYTTNLANPNWQNLGDPVTGNSLPIVTTNGSMFYRIVSQ